MAPGWILVVLGVVGSNPEPSLDQTSGVDEPYRTVVEHDAGENARRRRAAALAKTPGFASAVELEEAREEHPNALGDRVARTPGVSVRSMGGLGQYSAISLRGSSAQQVRVFLDGVPVDGSLSGLANLSSASSDTLSHLEVYRGYMPIAYGGATMGGALAMYSRVHDPAFKYAFSGHLGWGSFGARRLSLAWGQKLASRGLLFLSMAYAGSTGDFPFFDDGGTPHQLLDDKTNIRRNNGYDRFTFYGSYQWEKSWTHTLRWKGDMQDLQIPGMGRVQSTRAGQESLAFRFSHRSSRDFDRPGARLDLVSGVWAQWRRYQDPIGEVGLGQDDEKGKTLDGYVSLQLRWPLSSSARIESAVDQRMERVRIDTRNEQATNAAMPLSPDAVRMRYSTGLSLQLKKYWADGDILLQPALRFDVAQSMFSIVDKDDDAEDHLQLGISPRLGGAAYLGKGLELRASGGRYLRLPTLMELFGDRGFIVGNEALVAERGWNLDAGILGRWEHSVALELSGAFFASWPKELIAWQRAGVRMLARNLRRARIWGVESEFHLGLWQGRVLLDADYTWTATSNDGAERSQRGQALPGRPAHQLHSSLLGSRAAVRAWKLGGGPSFDLITGNFLDVSGRYAVPARRLFGLSAFVGYAGWKLSCALRNLGDQRTGTIVPVAGTQGAFPAAISDFMGYPLPGRSLWCSLGFKKNRS